MRLPETFWCYDPMNLESPSANELPAAANGYITFGCLNNFCKLNADTLRVWMRLLRTVPSSRLLLLSPAGSSRQWVERVVVECGIAPDRIEHVSRRPRHAICSNSFIESTSRSNTLPYNGHTTSLDSLWMGVPVITMAGKTIVGRAGVSELKNVGLTEFIAPDTDEFVRVAAALAGDIERLKALRSSLRTRMEQSPLMDGKRFAHNFVERFTRDLWRPLV